MTLLHAVFPNHVYYCEKLLLATMLSKLLIILKIKKRSNLCLLYNNDDRLSFLNLSLYDIF